MFRNVIVMRFNKIMSVNCHPYLFRKITMQDTRHELNAGFSGSNYGVSLYSKIKCHRSLTLNLDPYFII